jgi:hypothetical protein
MRRFALLVVIVVGCGKTDGAKVPPAASPPPPTAPAAPPAPAVDAAAADPNAAKCEDIRVRFRAALAAGTGACKTPADCGCYSPVGGPSEGCGGATDKATSKKLEPLLGEFQAVPCDWQQQCEAWACAPKCVAGKCTR